MNPYEILEVAKNSSDSDIKKAFRKLASKYHPDKGGDEEKFKQINEAYSTIATAEKRQEYEASQFHNSSQSHYRGNPFSDFGLGDIFGDLFGGHRQQQRQRPKEQTDEDITFNLKISLANIKAGASQEILYNRNIKCFTCHGNGGDNKHTCAYCHGKGYQVFQQGPIVQQSTCRPCNGNGFVFETICNTCGGHGIVRAQEKISVKIETNN